MMELPTACGTTVNLLIRRFATTKYETGVVAAVALGDGRAPSGGSSWLGREEGYLPAGVGLVAIQDLVRG